jgi:glycosyltransferase involved in cell wall biosynthesis
MKVIHLILGKANPERMNGVNKVVHSLATQQGRAGWNVEVWGITPDLIVNYPAREFTTRLFQACYLPFMIHADLGEALGQVAAETVVHLHGGFIPAYYSAARKMSALGIQYVVTPHGSYNAQAMHKNRLVKHVYMSLCEKYLLEHAAMVHCLGQSEVSGLEGMYATLATCLLPYGFEVPATPAVAAPQPHGIFRVGFCGRLDEKHKGLNCLIAGFAEFVQHVPAAELWIIGDGPDRKKVAQWAALVPAGKVKLLGSRYGEEKMGLLAQLDAFAHPSNYEGLPTAVLEAASLGIPCVVTEATNMGEYIRHFECGEVVEQAQPAQLAAGLFRLYQQWVHTPRQQMSQRCHAMVTTAFYWPTLLQEYQRMYRRAYYA